MGTYFIQDYRNPEAVFCISVWLQNAVQRECKASSTGSKALLDLKAKATLSCGSGGITFAH